MRKNNGRTLETVHKTVFTEQLRRVMAATVTDERLQAIIEAQIKLAEQGNQKAAEFVLKLCGHGQTPTKLVQNNYYYGPQTKNRKGLRAKTPLGNRIAGYIASHGPTKPAILATELEAELAEIEGEINSRPDRFRRGRLGIEVAA